MTHSPELATDLAPAAADPDSATRPQGMKRVATASLIGTVIEFYDFGICDTAAALVFPRIFFPALGSAAGSVASFTTIAVAFVARPFGSILSGHLGDHLGRTTTLIATLLVMGISTILVGLTPPGRPDRHSRTDPDRRAAHPAGPGGRWRARRSSAVLLRTRPEGQTRLWAMFPSFGGGGAILLSNLTLFITAVSMSDDTFVNWGRRVPLPPASCWSSWASGRDFASWRPRFSRNRSRARA
jgi:MFS family permease